MVALGVAPLIATSFLVLGLVVLAALRYRSWISRCTQRLVNGSKVIETSEGRVEYATIGAGGPVLLFVHPQPGGYDQGELLADAAVRHGFRVLTASRPGYLRTPLDVGRSPAEQADALAALLDALGIHYVAVVSLSGGGPAGLQFALRHPQRCFALAAISAVSRPNPPPTNFAGWLLSTRLFTSNVAGWLLGAAVKLQPALLARALVPDAKSRTEILSDPRKLSALVTLAQAGIQLPAQRRLGSLNDVEQSATLPPVPVETIRVPTLVIHGTADNLVPYTHGQFVAEGVPDAELYAINDGTHAVFVTHTDQVLSRLFAFLGKHSKNLGVQSQ